MCEAMSKNSGSDPLEDGGSTEQLIVHGGSTSGCDNSNNLVTSEQITASEDTTVNLEFKLDISAGGATSRPTSSGTGCSAVPSCTRATTSSRPSSSSTTSSSRPSSSGGSGTKRQECHSRTSSLSSGDGLLLSVSALARGGNPQQQQGATRQDQPNSELGQQQCMGQSGTRQAGVHTSSGPPSGEREDPEGLTDGEDEIQSGLGSLLAVDKRVFGRLQEELTAAQSELKLKEEEVTRLSRIRDDVESELTDLTASLFQEAHNMVREANVKAAMSEKALVESNMKVDGLMMEVAALKALVITSTPAKPNPHLHPQISGGKSASPAVRGGGSTPGTPTKERLSGVGSDETDGGGAEKKEEKFMDPVLRGEYLDWKKSPKMDPELPFFVRIYREDINPCLEFPNESLSAEVKEAVLQNTICISPVKESLELPRNCSLLEQPRRCTHIITLGEGDDNQHFVSQLARNRIAAVCDFLLYCRYITQGLVKQHTNEVYWQIINRRKNMTLARFGFTHN